MAVTDANALVAENLNDTAEIERARELSRRYRCPFLNLREQNIKAELVRSIPAELMFRYNFVPLRGRRGYSHHCHRRPQSFPADR